MLETVAYWMIGIGLGFDLFGCIGLVRLPDVYNRAQAATKCVTGPGSAKPSQLNWLGLARISPSAAEILPT